MHDNVEGDVGHEYEVHPFGQLGFAKLHGEENRHNRQNVCQIAPVTSLCEIRTLQSWLINNLTQASASNWTEVGA